MITYNNFGKLRLKNFVANPQEIRNFRGFEFMGCSWKGQAIGFTEWLHTGRFIKRTKSVSIALDELSDEVGNKMIAALGLDLYKGMKEGEVLQRFGQPGKILHFVKDRQTFKYVIGEKEKYYLSLTIHNSKGLIYIVLANFKEALNELS